MFPIVITPAKKMQGNQERMYRKSGDVYLCRGEETHDSNMSNSIRAQQLNCLNTWAKNIREQTE